MKVFFRVAAAASAIGALYHTAALAIPAFAAATYPPDYPAWRHAIFIAIGAATAPLLIVRPHWLVWPYALLTLQVLNGHGRDAWAHWRASGRIDWLSVAVCVGVTTVLVMLIVDRRRRQA